ncbi:MAG: cytochrome C oxidase subunit IV family protein [Chloroflexota bacterium]
MTDQAQKEALYHEAVQIVSAAEKQIETIFEKADVAAAMKVVRDPDINEGIAEAKQMVAAAREEASAIAEDTVNQIHEIMGGTGDPEEEEMLKKILNSALQARDPGVRFSEHIERAAGRDLSGIEATAFRFEAGLEAMLLPWLQNWRTNMETTAQSSPAHALHSDHVELMGREFTVPGGLYTVVFVVLAVVTMVEVIIAESPMPNAIGYPLLAALSIGKAVLVVLYYMHLREDSRIFAYAFGIPLGMAALISIFLLLVDPVIY